MLTTLLTEARLLPTVNVIASPLLVPVTDLVEGSQPTVRPRLSNTALNGTMTELFRIYGEPAGNET
ncbi:hypothetical protein D3C76_1503300 [compost metagenome]